jgi:hypothetical protein
MSAAKRKYNEWHLFPWALPDEAYEALIACGWNWLYDGVSNDQFGINPEHPAKMSFAGWCYVRK